MPSFLLQSIIILFIHTSFPRSYPHMTKFIYMLCKKQEPAEFPPGQPLSLLLYLFQTMFFLILFVGAYPRVKLLLLSCHNLFKT